MTGYKSKRAAAQDKLDDDDALTIAYQSGYYDGKKAAQRPWVGLTSADWNDFNAAKSNDPQYVTAWAEEKLKEKNT